MVHRILIVPVNHEDFITSCRSIATHSPSVSLNLDRLDVFLPAVQGRTYADWSWYLPSGDLDPGQALREFAFNAALNGGYFQETPGGIRQWESGGSGSQALLDWIAELRKDNLLTPIGLLGNEIAQESYKARLEGLPHADERFQIIMSFASREGDAALLKLARDLEADRKSRGVYHLNLSHVDELARAFPLAFGEDPFRKKAVLALLMFAGWLFHRREETVSAALPIPSDYQIPRIFAWKGVIKTSAELERMIRNDRALLDVDCEPVTAFRAAAVVAAHELGLKAGVADIVVDGALFSTFRKDPEFQAAALPPMRCASMWF